MKSFLQRTTQHPPHDPTMPSLQLHQVTAVYDGVTALAQVSFALAQGDQVAVVGPNGAGKSTLFNIIAGTLKPTQGTVTIYGSGPQGHICVGYVPQRNRIDWRFPITVIFWYSVIRTLWEIVSLLTNWGINNSVAVAILFAALSTGVLILLGWDTMKKEKK